MENKENKVNALEQRGRVEGVKADEGGRGARDEDAHLVDCVVHWVSIAVGFEGHVTKGEEQSRSDALVDGVFSDIDKQEREHAVEY